MNDPKGADEHAGTLPGEVSRAALWLYDSALPLWASTGFDTARGAFHEQLDFSLRPITDTPRRLMVQARQVSVFCSAALTGRFNDGEELALVAAQNMIERYENADGAAGYVFALHDNGAVDGLRDLYGHAFALFALSWAIRLDPRQIFFQAIERIISFIDSYLFDTECGGYWDSLPRTDALRRQNPHMHLFEAFIELYEATGQARFLASGERLRVLMMTKLLARDSGALREYFDSSWSVHPAEGQGRVEPGHLFEWAWLLTRYDSMSGQNSSTLIRKMMSMAVDYGLDRQTGRIIDEIDENGQSLSTTSRSWPHAEALKALSTIQPRLGGGEELTMAKILRRLMTVYCKSSLNGGWQDQLDSRDRPSRSNIPASTLYHIYFGITSVEKYVQSR